MSVYRYRDKSYTVGQVSPTIRDQPKKLRQPPNPPSLVRALLRTEVTKLMVSFVHLYCQDFSVGT